MKTKKIKYNSYNLIVTKVKHFKETSIKVVFKRPFDKNDITKDSLLIDMLTYSTKNYPNHVSFSNRAKDLYGTYVESYNSRIGNFNLLNVRISIVNENYVDIDTMKEAVILLKEIIFNPNLMGEEFDKDTYNITRERLTGILKNVKDNKSRYAELRMLESLDKTKPYAYNIDGNLKELKEITNHDLYLEYLKVLNDSEINVYVTGDIDLEKVERLFKENITFPSVNKKYKDVFIANTISPKMKMIVEKTNNVQSKLSIGCKIDNPKKKVLNALFLYNIIFGASTKSRLFLNVREKLSYAYYINSGLNLTDNILVINSGIDKKNLMNVINEIKKEMDDIKKGNIKDEELEMAKKTYINSSLALFDNLSSLGEAISGFDTFGKDTYFKRLNAIKKVTKEDVVEVAQLIHFDTVFLLEEGDKNEEN